jgi:GNAT superfamily N-acetyltransferase
MSGAHHELREGSLLYSDDPALLDVGVIHGYLSRSYWAEQIPRATVEKSIRHSMGFGVYDQTVTPSQVAFARVITDRATFAYLCDVFVLESHRKRGISKTLVAHVLSHPELQGLRRFCLLTWDAHGVYTPFGFASMKDPSRYLEIARPGLYAAQAAAKPGIDGGT